MPQTEPKIPSGISGAEPSSEGKELTPQEILREVGAQAQEFFSALSKSNGFPQDIFEKMNENLDLLVKEAKARDDLKRVNELDQLFWKEISDAREAEGFVLSQDMREILQNEFRNKYIELCISDMNGGKNIQAEKVVADSQLKMWMMGMSPQDTDAIITQARELSGYDKWLERQEQEKRGQTASPPQRSEGRVKQQVPKRETPGEFLAMLDNALEDFFAAEIRRGLVKKDATLGIIPPEIETLEAEALKAGVSPADIGELREAVKRRTGFYDFLASRKKQQAAAARSEPVTAPQPEISGRPGRGKNPKLSPWATESILSVEGDVFEGRVDTTKATQRMAQEGIAISEGDVLTQAAQRDKIRKQAEAVSGAKESQEAALGPEHKEKLDRFEKGLQALKTHLQSSLQKGLKAVELEQMRSILEEIWSDLGLPSDYQDKFITQRIKELKAELLV